MEINIVHLQNYLLCDEDIEGRKSSKAKELGFVISLIGNFSLSSLLPCYFCLFLVSISYCSTAFLTEDGLFDMIRASNHGKSHSKEESKKSAVNVAASLSKRSPQKTEVKSMPQMSIHSCLWCIIFCGQLDIIVYVFVMA